MANIFQAQTWSPQVINTRIIGPNAADSTDIEHVCVSCETDVQGRLFGRAGQVLGAAFKAQLHDITFGSFKGAIPPYPGYSKVPDFVTIDHSSIALAVGSQLHTNDQRHCCTSGGGEWIITKSITVREDHKSHYEFAAREVPDTTIHVVPHLAWLLAHPDTKVWVTPISLHPSLISSEHQKLLALWHPRDPSSFLIYHRNCT